MKTVKTILCNPVYLKKHLKEEEIDEHTNPTCPFQDHCLDFIAAMHPVQVKGGWTCKFCMYFKVFWTIPKDDILSRPDYWENETVYQTGYFWGD